MNKLLRTVIIGVFLVTTAFVGSVAAVLTIPNTIMYQGVLYNGTGAPITTAQNIRFSIWDTPSLGGDTFLGDGSVNPAAVGYQNFVEEHTITPNSRGVFSVPIGSIATLPNFDATKHLHLQVELKPVGAPVTSYEVLDPDGIPANGNDRKPIASAPYASNANMVDNREVGIMEGNIAVLGPNGRWTMDQIPGGTTEESFVIDANDASMMPTLSFGTASANFLRFDVAEQWFEFSHDVNFNQNQAVNFVLHKGTAFPLTPVAGQQFYREDLQSVFFFDGVNWVDVTDSATLSGVSSDTFTIDNDNSATTIGLEFGSATGQLLNFDTIADRFVMTNDLFVDGTIAQAGNTMTLGTANTGGGSNVEIIAQQGDDPSGILRYNATTNLWEFSNNGVNFSPMVGADMTQILENKTIDGDLNTLQNIDFSSMKPRAKQMKITAEYGGFTLQPDGTENSGTMSSDFVDLGGLDKFLFYRWATRKLTMQDMDVILKVTLPSDFIGFQVNPVSVQYRTATTDTLENRVDITMSDSAGDAVILTGATNLVSTTFGEALLGFGGTPTFTADGMMLLKIKLSTLVDRYADLGDITLYYYGR